MSDDERFTIETDVSDREQPGNNSFPIVGVGASAGGLNAFIELLSGLPDNTGMAFVLVQHLDPKHASNLCEILSKVTSIPVLEASQDLAVRANHIYVIAPNTTLTIVHGKLRLTARGEARQLHLPIDLFLKSLAAEHRTHAIAVILSGSGTDGTVGVEEVRAAGGITMAQDERSAKYPSMPQSAVRSGCVDLVLPPEAIARELARIGQHPYLVPSHTEGSALPSVPEKRTPASDDDFNKILALLHAAFGVDFRGYRDGTLRRRIQRRMVLNTHEDLADYAQQLQQNRLELDALYRDVLINVTSFFREPESFEALKRTVFPQIIEGKAANKPIRIWAPGCSTGQEAYSLAMALLEFLDDKATTPAIQIFASDLGDNVSLQRARDGIYPQNIELEVSPERLRRFFTKGDSTYRVIKTLRELCVFAKQDVSKDPPFSRLDLISCRNLLIYLAPTLQKRIIPTFHYALNQPGFLMLGKSETVGSFNDLFEIVDHKHRIYARKATAAHQYPYFKATEYSAGNQRALVHNSAVSTADWQREADRIAVGHYAPRGVLVNESFDVLQFRGETEAFLKPAPGEPSHNLLKMAREGLLTVLRSALHECRQKGAPVRRKGVRVRSAVGNLRIDLHVLPVKLPQGAERCFLVLFEETARGESEREPLVSTERSTEAEGSEAAVRDQELASMREYIQSITEQQDATNEELMSANEEILSGNEELQSTNEELQTSKEELESVNEELTTVNEQLQNRNQELSRLSDALTNLQASANIPMLELSVDLRIRRLTPAAAKALNLVPGDLGRALDDVRLAFEIPDMKALVLEVIDTLQFKEREVRDANGRWYALRIHPYRTEDNRIDGVVVVFVDIDEAKSAQERLRESRDYAESLIETMRDPFLVLNNELYIVSANQAFYQAFAVTPAETVGRIVYDIGNRQWDIPALRDLLENILPGRKVFQNFEVEHYFEHIGDKIMLLDARHIVRQGQDTELILLAIEDITESKRLEADLRRSTDELLEADRRKNEFLAMLAHELRNPLAPVRNGLAILDRIGSQDEIPRQTRAMMERQVDHMSRLLEDLLDISRITSGKVELHKEWVELTEVI
ncbi:MAG: chemotaxis protein CheB, partial [Nitrospira sp.]